jgi:hypothetical protein
VSETRIFVACSGRAGNNPRRASRRSLIAFLGGLALLAGRAPRDGPFPVLSTLAAIVGIAAMIYGLAAGVMMVLNRLASDGMSRIPRAHLLTLQRDRPHWAPGIVGLVWCARRGVRRRGWHLAFGRSTMRALAPGEDDTRYAT